MRIKNKIFIICICFTALVCLLLPAKTLFTGNGFLVWQIRQPETVFMAAEALIIFLILTACLFFIRDRTRQLAAVILCCLVVCWLHVIFLPMLLSGLYLGLILLLGRWFGRFVIGKGKAAEGLRGARALYGVPADFLLGSGLLITLYCILSAAGAGSILILQRTAAVLGAVLYGWFFFSFFKGRQTVSGSRGSGRGGAVQGRPVRTRPGRGRSRQAGRGITALLTAFVITLLLVQAARMNISLDFDSLWYGVRSEYILDSGRGIYENPGLVGMVYVYSKGLEILTLPLCNLLSHSYLIFFNLWLAALGLLMCGAIARFFMSRSFALLAAAVTAAIPAVLNMSLSAKPDIITWLLQLILIFYLLCYMRGIEGRTESKGNLYLFLAVCAYLVSLTMKPTSLVFSTAVFGMAALYLIFSGNLHFGGSLRQIGVLLPGIFALIGVWARTMLITGMPVTSVFTSIFALLGFHLKYPFAASSLPQNWQDENGVFVLFRRLYQMLLAPSGKDMSHVVIAWGSSLIFFLLVCLAISALLQAMARRRRQAPCRVRDRVSRAAVSERAGGCCQSSLRLAVHVVFWPFLAVCLVSLYMLYQVDGNYFILLYTMIILAACASLEQIGQRRVRRVCLALLAPMLAFSVLIALMTNWAWSLGFTPIQILNSGRVNHEALQHDQMIQKGNEKIWDILAADPQNRVIAFGDHPACLSFPCNVQSYKDITAPWGNVELVNTAGAFEQYMGYAKTKYVYVEAGFIGNTSWSWSYGLLKAMIADGTLTDLFFEDGNVLAKVDLGRSAALPGAGNETEAAKNLQLFNENYRTSEQLKESPKDSRQA